MIHMTKAELAKYPPLEVMVFYTIRSGAAHFIAENTRTETPRQVADHLLQLLHDSGLDHTVTKIRVCEYRPEGLFARAYSYDLALGGSHGT